MKEKKTRIEDALSATRAAVEEGIVPGGGTAYINALKALDSVEADGDELTGVNIIRRALEEPVRQIAENAGEEGSIVVEKVKEAAAGVGYDAATGPYVDMIDSGIPDPAKVTRSALQTLPALLPCSSPPKQWLLTSLRKTKTQQQQHRNANKKKVLGETPTPFLNL